MNLNIFHERISVIIGLYFVVALFFFLVYLIFKDFFKEAIRHKKWRIPIGIGLIIVGILGIFLPVIPGWLLIFAGLTALRLFFMKRLIKRLKKKLGV